MTIGERAVRAIYDRAEKNNTTVLIECAILGLNESVFRDWAKRYNPSAFYLQQMALQGYDVFWILTGERKDYETTE